MFIIIYIYIYVQEQVTPDGSNLDLSKFLITQSESPVPILFTTQLSNYTWFFWDFRWTIHASLMNKG